MADGSGVLDFLFNGSPPPAANAAVQTQQGSPDWYQQYLKSLADRSSTIAGAPYQSFPGPTVAERSPLQEQATNLAQSTAGQFTPAVQGALSGLQGIANNNNATDPLMDSIARLGTRNLNENLLPAINQTYIGAGQFGGSRQDEFTARATRDTNESILNAQAQALLSNQQQKISANSGIGTLSQLGQTMNLRDAASLDTAGQEVQGQNQANINAGINQFNNEVQYPQNQALFMSNILRGINAPTASATTTTAPFTGAMQPSGLATLAGSALTATALQSLFKAKGGLIHLARGGMADPAMNEERTLPENVSPLVRRQPKSKYSPGIPTHRVGPSRFQKALLPRPKRGALGYLRQPRV